MIEFLAQMPTEAKIFLTMAVLGLAATLIALRRSGPWRGLQIFWTPARRIRIDKGAINTGA
jgi:hypothetical protein